jgi:hypothetical protein
MSEQPAHKQFVTSLSGMLSRAEFHHPIAAAQQQFRDRYYGMTAAAMLEDLFFDAFAVFLHTYHPTTSLSRPPRGEKGYDYEFSGTRVSHKVSKKGPLEIAALWDATRTDVTTWSFKQPICFFPGEYGGVLQTKRLGDEKRQTWKAASTQPNAKAHEQICLVRWLSLSEFEVLHVWRLKSDGAVRELIPFHDVWTAVSAAEAASNETELLVAQTLAQPAIDTGDRFAVNGTNFRPGFYVLSVEMLQNLEVTHNNRAILIPKTTVAGLMTKALSREDFVPITKWFAVYAGLNPPDLYLVQRSQWDQVLAGTP